MNGVQPEAKATNSSDMFWGIYRYLAACLGMASRDVFPYEPEGREFESLRAHHLLPENKQVKGQTRVLSLPCFGAIVPNYVRTMIVLY